MESAADSGCLPFSFLSACTGTGDRLRPAGRVASRRHRCDSGAAGDRRKETAGRNFHAVGKNGRIWGNSHEQKVFVYDNSKKETHVYDTAADNSGCDSNRLHALELHKMMVNPTYQPAQNAYIGYVSAIMCFGAEISRNECRRVNFVYQNNDYIDIS